MFVMKRAHGYYGNQQYMRRYAEIGDYYREQSEKKNGGFSDSLEIDLKMQQNKAFNATNSWT